MPAILGKSKDKIMKIEQNKNGQIVVEGNANYANIKKRYVWIEMKRVLNDHAGVSIGKHGGSIGFSWRISEVMKVCNGEFEFREREEWCHTNMEEVPEHIKIMAH